MIHIIEVLLFVCESPGPKADGFRGNIVLFLQYSIAYLSVKGVSIQSIPSIVL